MDLNIFADPDPGSQNLADPTDPDPDPVLFNSDITNLFPYDQTER